jgi:hypothetical protein
VESNCNRDNHVARLVIRAIKCISGRVEDDDKETARRRVAREKTDKRSGGQVKGWRTCVKSTKECERRETATRIDGGLVEGQTKVTASMTTMQTDEFGNEGE